MPSPPKSLLLMYSSIHSALILRIMLSLVKRLNDKKRVVSKPFGPLFTPTLLPIVRFVYLSSNKEDSYRYDFDLRWR